MKIANSDKIHFPCCRFNPLKRRYVNCCSFISFYIHFIVVKLSHCDTSCIDQRHGRRFYHIPKLIRKIFFSMPKKLVAFPGEHQLKYLDDVSFLPISCSLLFALFVVACLVDSRDSTPMCRGASKHDFCDLFDVLIVNTTKQFDRVNS